MPVAEKDTQVRGFYAAGLAKDMPARAWTWDILVALSAANLFYYPAWDRVLDGAENYFSKAHPHAEVYAAFLNVLLLTLLLLPLVRLAFVRGRGFARGAAFWLLLLTPLAIFRPARWEIYLIEMFGYIFLALLFALFLIAAHHRKRSLLTLLRFVALCALPFVLVTFGRGLLLLPAQDERAPLFPARASDAPRVVWVIFDALDYRIAFAERPRELRLPEFDAITASAFTATQAQQTSFATKSALPSLLSGRIATSGTVYGTDELLVRFADSRTLERWTATSNIFTRARDLKVNAALQGWYHPYCRLFGEQVVSCDWWEYVPTIGVRPEGGVADRALDQWYLIARSAVRVGYHTPFYSAQRRRLPADPDRDARRKARMHVEQLDALKRSAADPSIGLVVSHLGVPHIPAFYDRAKQEFALTGSYLDNLALADRTLGELRQALNESGMAERTVLILTSDHAFRGRSVGAHWIAADQKLFEGHKDTRVPLIVHFPGRQARAVFNAGFNTAVTHDLVLDLLRGDVRTPQQVAEWLDQRTPR
jgi:hypothetical protein